MASLFKRGGDGPWIVSYFDHTGRRREHSTRTTDHATAKRIAAKLEGDTALRRDGVIDPSADRFAEQNRRPLSEHLGEYMRHCEHAGQAPRWLVVKLAHLQGCIDDAGAARLSDLTADALESYQRKLKDNGRSARTANAARAAAVAFCSWCVRTRRIESNPLRVVPKLDEERDRRRIRRPLTEGELSRLLDVADERGRRLWYLTAALAGLRRSELRKLSWDDIDLGAGTITIRDGKAKHRTDVLPIHPQLAEALRAARPALHPDTVRVRVFKAEPTNATRIRDFERAGIYHRETIRDDAGDSVMVGKGKRRRPLTRLVIVDAEGKVADLHALRTTLGTQLARAGVAPQVCQRIMRHGDYKTTLRHYTVLGLNDTAAAVRLLPDIDTPGRERQRATGTYDATPDDRRTGRKHPPQIPQQSECFSQLHGARPCESDRERHDLSPGTQAVASSRVNDAKRRRAEQCETAGDATRTRNNQLGRLMLYH